MRKVHELKCHSGPFHALKDGNKTLEFRKDDRDFQVRDILVLREWWPEAVDADGNLGEYGYDLLVREVTHILRGGEYGVPEGYVAMSLGAPP